MGDFPSGAGEPRAHLAWRRLGSPKDGFTYANRGGVPIVARRHVSRIEKLRIPPAWTDVEISSDPAAELQAVGRDAKGRLQYLYHPRTVEERERAKFARQTRFGANLPDIRERTNADLRGEELDRDFVSAVVVRLIDEAYFRVGSERYAEQNRTYGITTLAKNHIRVLGDALLFTYRGKSGQDQRTVIVDPPLAAAVERILELPGRRLFRYLEGSEPRNLSAHEVNRYIKRTMGRSTSAKDFRTWHGTVIAAEMLADAGPTEVPRTRKRRITAAVKEVAALLGNTPAVARASYINPVVLDWYEDGVTIEDYVRRAERRVRSERLPYDPNEVALLALLRRRRLRAADAA
jgi:DNA topoisomerase I